jgi:hypothetical protein
MGTVCFAGGKEPGSLLIAAGRQDGPMNVLRVVLGLAIAAIGFRPTKKVRSRQMRLCAT